MSITVNLPPSLCRLANRGYHLRGKPITSPLRLWLLLHAIAKSNGGWLTHDKVRTELTSHQGKFRLFGPRRLAAVIFQGEGVFWKVSDNKQGERRIWLHGLAHICQQLGIERLYGRPLEVPLSELLQPMPKVRSVFYAATLANHDESKPVSRRSLETMTGCSKRRQRTYERHQGITTTRHYANKGEYSDHKLQSTRYDGYAAFPLKDRNGRFGKLGKWYVAHHLPSTYHLPATHTLGSMAQTRRVNRRLQIDPCRKGNGGNGEQLDKLYCDHATEAMRNWQQNQKRVYYPSDGHPLFWSVQEASPFL